MSPVEEEGSLCKVLTQLSEVWEGVSCRHNEHMEEGCFTLLEFIKDCLGLIISAKVRLWFFTDRAMLLLIIKKN